MSESPFPPGVEYGKRIPISVIESRAQNPDDKPWVSVPINEEDLSRGFKDISFRQLNNWANHAAHWLSQNLPQTDEPFQSFAYAGPKDLRYPILATAVAKLQKVMILPSPLITPEAQMRVLDAKKCTVYLRPASMAEEVGDILKDAPEVTVITVPEPDEFMRGTEAIPFSYPKTWEEGKDDPWLVFHTSGLPKPITVTHAKFATVERGLSVPDGEPSMAHKWVNRRLYTPVPSLHFFGFGMLITYTTFLRATLVLGPSTPPSPQTVADVLHYGRVKGAAITPALIEELCRTPVGFHALCQLDFICFVGAPLSAHTGNQLIPHVDILPRIGSTEAGPYPIVPHDKEDAWDYARFHSKSGIVFEYRYDDMYEMIMERPPGEIMQMIWYTYPELDRFETKDLWVKHPVYEGFWKIVGRTDDYIPLSHADGLYAASLEPEIEAHPAVKAAVIGGHGRPAPVLVVEVYPDAVEGKSAEEIVASLRPNIERANARCHACVQIAMERVILTQEGKPFARTSKGSVARKPSLDLYKDEIAALFD
ncbi:AMP-binding enzyme [Penicillium capsulatum]|uniref:AMP-binding enzyme n=1 Tax=Penicillium capsulatum TaxID=69766 RepID=A0A9W9LGV1_9EURO|nr:AMP-binding enzyme [Penicillium capsulatum]